MVAAAAVLAAGCTSDPPPQTGAPTPTSAQWPPPTPDLSYEQALARVPLDGGTPDAPIYWRTDQLADGAGEPARVAQLYEALLHLLITDPPPDRPVELLPYVATETRMQDAGYRLRLSDPVVPDPDPSVGPQWYWIMDAVLAPPDLVPAQCIDLLRYEEGADDYCIDRAARAVVVMCHDFGYFGRRSLGGGTPPPQSPEARGLVVGYTMRRELAGDRQLRWKVNKVTLLPQVAEERYQGRCRRWAVGNTLEDLEE